MKVVFVRCKNKLFKLIYRACAKEIIRKLVEEPLMKVVFVRCTK
jgi:hypothetical protein